MTDRDDRIPITEFYKGVGIHDRQGRLRIDTVVKPEIDSVLGMDDVKTLYEFARFTGNCPEARLLAGAKLQAIWQLAGEERRIRPAGVTLDLVRASVAGLNSSHWRSPTHYCSILDYSKLDDAVERKVPLADDC